MQASWAMDCTVATTISSSSTSSSNTEGAMPTGTRPPTWGSMGPMGQPNRPRPMTRSAEALREATTRAPMARLRHIRPPEPARPGPSIVVFWERQPARARARPVHCEAHWGMWFGSVGFVLQRSGACLRC